MARGKHFNHKERGHAPKIPKQGQQVAAKDTEHIEYDIDIVATENEGPVSFKVVED